MKKNITLLTSIAILAAQSGYSAAEAPIECSNSRLISLMGQEIVDRTLLQDELTFLLEMDPNNICIDQIVSLLGVSSSVQMTQVNPY